MSAAALVALGPVAFSVAASEYKFLRRLADLNTVTQWFPTNTRPVHVGLYETAWCGERSFPVKTRWNGKQWIDIYRGGVLTTQNREWRGLAVKP